MTNNQKSLTSASNGFGIAILAMFGISILGFMFGDAGGSAVLFILAIVMACFWGFFNMVGRFAGFGTVEQHVQTQAQKIAAYEKEHGLSPVGWQFPWFGGRKFGCDIHGLFIETKDGTRLRDV